MKKNKGSKGKKLFIKKESPVPEETLTTGETPGNISESQPVSNRIEFEEAEGGPRQQKTVPKPLDNKDAWQQAFVDENTILIKRTVRSGQSIQFDGNVVVMGDVNPGSEIIASGNVVVMGALRGVVHAGATGNEEATVSAFKLQPTQLRIANHITRPPDGEHSSPEYPEIARIKDGVVVIEVYQMGQDRQTKIC